MTADRQARRVLGTPGTRVGLGCAPLGNLFREVTDHDAAATVDAAWERGVRLFDTAPHYGAGLAERRLGAALRGRPRGEYVLSSKVGRLVVPAPVDPSSIFVGVGPWASQFDFSRDGILRSVEASLTRLGVDHLDIAHVHDPDGHEAEALATAFPTLLELREQGVVRAVGCGMNQTAMLTRFVQRVDLDVVLVAGRYSLLDRSAADALLPLCGERGVQVMVGGVFNSGVLAAADPSAATFDYAPPSPDVLARVEAMRSACDAAGVPLADAAVQFPLRSAAVASIVVGARSPAEITAALDGAASETPAHVWSSLDAIAVGRVGIEPTTQGL